MAAVPLDIEADVIGVDPLHPDEVTRVRGQARVAKCPGVVRQVRLLPDAPPACTETVEAIRAADHIVPGPGRGSPRCWCTCSCPRWPTRS